MPRRFDCASTSTRSCGLRSCHTWASTTATRQRVASRAAMHSKSARGDRLFHTKRPLGRWSSRCSLQKRYVFCTSCDTDLSDVSFQSLRELVEAIAAIPSCAIEFMQIAEQSITRLLTRATTKSNEVRLGSIATFLPALTCIAGDARHRSGKVHKGGSERL